jgi:hypothetical protein
LEFIETLSENGNQHYEKKLRVRLSPGANQTRRSPAGENGSDWTIFRDSDLAEKGLDTLHHYGNTKTIQSCHKKIPAPSGTRG